MILVTVLLIALSLFVLYRSWQDVALSLGSTGIALLWTYGTLAWLDWPQDGILEVLAPLILVVGVCDAVHLLSRYAEIGVQDKANTKDARCFRLLETAREIGGPCFITTATTVTRSKLATPSHTIRYRQNIAKPIMSPALLLLPSLFLDIGAMPLEHVQHR